MGYIDGCVCIRQLRFGIFFRFFIKFGGFECSVVQYSFFGFRCGFIFNFFVFILFEFRFFRIIFIDGQKFFLVWEIRIFLFFIILSSRCIFCGCKKFGWGGCRGEDSGGYGEMSGGVQVEVSFFRVSFGIGSVCIYIFIFQIEK